MANSNWIDVSESPAPAPNAASRETASAAAANKNCRAGAEEATMDVAIGAAHAAGNAMGQSTPTQHQTPNTKHQTMGKTQVSCQL
jgi:hypothetical protein